MNFQKDISNCLAVLKNGGLILYPTDTIWGIGCDGQNEMAVNKVYDLKKRSREKSMIILVADTSDVLKYTEGVDANRVEEITQSANPTTIVFQKAANLPLNLVNDDGSIAIRIVRDNFCKTLIGQFHNPLVSTSANISGSATPQSFEDISQEIKNGVDYVVQHRQDENISVPPSSIIKLNVDGTTTKIR
ncbi:MAG: L-threonylcarbamoyladenylate synthase [Ginsengibacter sp.]